MSDHPVVGRAARLDRALADLLRQAPELEAAAVVSFDGLAMASALPSDMDEDRVAAMSAALLSLGEKAAQGLGRGDLSQVYVEGETGTVFLISADDEAVLVAVAAAGAKAGLMLFEVRRAAARIGVVLAAEAQDEAPLEVDDAVLADAEAAYQAHKAAQAAAAEPLALAPSAEPIDVDTDETDAAITSEQVTEAAPLLHVVTDAEPTAAAESAVEPEPEPEPERDPLAREEAERAHREAALAFLPSTSPILMPVETAATAAPREAVEVLTDDDFETPEPEPRPTASTWAPYVGQAPHWS